MPSSYSQAIHSPEADEWHKATNDEIKALEENDTFLIVALPEGHEIVGVHRSILLKQDPKS